MENNYQNLRSLFFYFKSELIHLYPETETDQILNLLLEHWLGWKKIKVHLEMERELPAETYGLIIKALVQLKEGMPVQYIIGKVDFAGVKILVKQGVLIPRPETEELVEKIFKDHSQFIFNDLSLLDIGTGTGCIPVSLCKRFPSLNATGIDISDIAINNASENAFLNGCRINILKSNILDQNDWTGFSVFDIIVSNPPYVPEAEMKTIRKNVIDFEPHSALFVPDNDPLLFYRNISVFSYSHLTRPGCLYFEIHENYGTEVKKIMEEAGFEKVIVIKDFNGKNRFVKGEVRLSMIDQSYWHVDH